MENNSFPAEKSQLHPRNPHRFRYDFDQLMATLPGLKSLVITNAFGNKSIDFSNPVAVKTLNQALLKQFYGISYWDIPPDYLCPPIPGRADYLHHLADLIAKDCGKQSLPEIKVLDIGTGANCIYPIIGSRTYQWKFVASDIDTEALLAAQSNVDNNACLQNMIALRPQANKESIFKEIIQSNEVFALSMCNPPFHSSQIDALAGTNRKWKNLGKTKISKALNFGGQAHELWCEGGEQAFIAKMIEESTNYKNQVAWFTTLVSKKEKLPGIYKKLKALSALQIETIEMAQGQKTSRFVAWSFISKQARCNLYIASAL